MSKIHNDHPRLFFNNSTFKLVKGRALKEEKGLFDEMKARVDNLIGQKIEFKAPYVNDGTQNTDHEYGLRAAESAFLYRVLKEEKYLDLTKELLKALNSYYMLRNDAKLNIQWYAFSRIGTLCAFDWIFEDLSEKERVEIGGPLLITINGMLYDGKRTAFFRENTGDYKTGFYGPPCLAWYAGVVFHKTGIDDELAEKLLKKGYDDYTMLLEYRRNSAGDDGGAATAVLGYCMGAYPWAEFNFFHTFQSATGINISKEWPYVPDFLYYIYWNWLPGDKMFGYGDSPHFDNNLPLGSMHIHLSQMIHFYGETQPEMAELAKWMQTKVKRQPIDAIPFTRFLLVNTYDQINAAEPLQAMPSGMYFENMGQVFMRSGPSTDDTHALFTADGMISQHRHYDNNNFVIFKKGFRALDTGTRPEPGNQLTHYFCRTVAHNCILINMPGEVMPRYWGGPALSEEDLPIPNDGGQSKLLASDIVAFDENKDYVYIASDATKSYHEDKSKLVLRQFLFLLPDHFVIFDRVITVKPEYKKTWLLHTASEPMIKSNEFYEEYDNGKLFCRTIFPEYAGLTKIGGPGKQFWSGGRNWPLPVLTPEDWNYRRSNKVPLDTVPLLGQWRIEVVPIKAQSEDNFLHLIQVGDLGMKSMVASERIKTDDMMGVRFEINSKKYEIMFATLGEPAGQISIIQNGEKIRDEKFTNKVKLQQGLF
ncbi:MAG TPA: heparinase II/III family protein [Bacteroidales bacterium]|nr:heparinase II/III family protein [Bacteroidales bacterium]